MLRMKPLVNESKVEESYRKLTIEEKQVVNNTIAKFNKFNEHIYRPNSVKEVISAIKELCELAGKVALSETDDWFDSVTVKKDVKEINSNLTKFEKVANEVNTMQQRMEALYEDIGQKLGRYYQIGENDDRIPLAPSKKKAIAENANDPLGLIGHSIYYPKDELYKIDSFRNGKYYVTYTDYRKKSNPLLSIGWRTLKSDGYRHIVTDKNKKIDKWIPGK